MSASFTMFTFPPPGDGFSTTWWWLFHPMWKSHHQVMESAHSIWHLGISWWTSALTVVPQLKREFLEILIEFHWRSRGSNPALRRESPWLWPLHYHCLDDNCEINGPLHASQGFSFDDLWAAASPWPLTSDLQPLTKWHWKIAGLWPAIFSGTPGKFEAIIFRQLH